MPAAGDLPDPGTEPRSPTLKADYLPFETPEKSPSLHIHGLKILPLSGTGQFKSLLFKDELYIIVLLLCIWCVVFTW